MQRHYDAIIIGDSLAGRIACAKLARAGRRVLHFTEDQAISPAWITSSHHLEKLLETLDGRSCLTSRPTFQVLTPEARVDLAGRHPLDEELSREFPNDSQKLLGLFAELEKLGSQLESILHESGGVPLKGLGGHLAFRWGKAKKGQLRAAITTPLASTIEKLSLGDEANEFVRALFTGLSLCPVERLCMTEAALIWTSHTREHGLSASGLDTLLRHRFEQFHGQTEPLENLRHFDIVGKQVKQVTLKNGGNCTADHYLVASPDQLSTLSPAVKRDTLKLPPLPVRIVTSELEGEPSPLLSRRVILSGVPKLRMSFGNRGDKTLCAIDLPRGDAPPEEATLRDRLSSALTFCSYDLVYPQLTAPVKEPASRKCQFGQQQSVRLLKNTLLCHGASVMPALGSCGEVLLGTSIANSIIKRQSKNHK
jgi:hypothetical protein